MQGSIALEHAPVLSIDDGSGNAIGLIGNFDALSLTALEQAWLALALCIG